MEVYFSVSLRGRFVFRTDRFVNNDEGAARAQRALWDAFGPMDGYEVTRNERPAGWSVSDVKKEVPV